jgi:ATP-binding cassette subfamily B protein
MIDGEPLDDATLARLRRETAWVDPAVQLWNRSILANLEYAAEPGSAEHLGTVIEAAHLRRLLEHFDDGLQTVLGENGALVSGGEGQRVRFGRALLQKSPRLVILDEPFRGLDRATRTTLLARARSHWKNATVVCITHDIADSLSFDRVVVLDEGTICEQGEPADLMSRVDSRYAAMVSAERSLRTTTWGGVSWKKLWFEGGKLHDRSQDGSDHD